MQLLLAGGANELRQFLGRSKTDRRMYDGHSFKELDNRNQMATCHDITSFPATATMNSHLLLHTLLLVGEAVLVVS